MSAKPTTTRQKERQAVVDFFDQSYHWWPQVYERQLPRGFFSFEMLRRKEVVFEIVKGYCANHANLKILECGCGPGGLLRDLPAPAGEVYGLDINPESLHRVRRECGARQLVCGDLEELPFVTASFDMVLCIGVLSYLKDDRLALQEMTRLLKPGGLLILANPNLFRLDKLFDPYYLLAWPFRWLKTGERKSKEKETGFTSAMIRRYRFGQLDGIYRALGLRTCRHVGITYGPLRWWRKEYLPVAQSIRISEALVQLATRPGFTFLPQLANHWVTSLEKIALTAEEGT